MSAGAGDRARAVQPRAGRGQAKGASYRALAPAKVNLGLFLGPTRASDGRHELVTVMQSISLADELTLSVAGPGAERDELICPDVGVAPERNLALRALALFREATGWRAPPMCLQIVKRIPVAGGLAGGSADAAAVLRLVRHASGMGDRALLAELAFQLGADVPAQVRPGRWLATGAGERLQALAEPPEPPFGVLVLAGDQSLSTAAVYEEADRLGLARDAEQLERIHARVLRKAEDPLDPSDPLGASDLPEPGEPRDPGELLDNDLQPAALSLCPRIAETLQQARAAGARRALVSGSGPTVVGLFEDMAAARAAAGALAERVPAPVWAVPVGPEFGRPETV